MTILYSLLMAVFPWFSSAPRQTLFTVEHNKNTNIVVYEARMAADSLDEDEPVSAHWVMYADHGQLEDLSFFEKRMAYGWDIEKVESRNMFKMFITAFPKRPVIIQSSGGVAFATVMVAGQRSYLKKIYIYADESKTIPEVKYVDMFGETIVGRRAVTERLTP